MSADVLRAAATKLREAAEAATPGPWESLGNGHIEGASANGHVGTVKSWNLAYITTLDPDVGLALAAWLEAEAGELARRHPTLLVHNALAVARSIVGGDES